jgi:hypothetical protein
MSRSSLWHCGPTPARSPGPRRHGRQPWRLGALSFLCGALSAVTASSKGASVRFFRLNFSGASAAGPARCAGSRVFIQSIATASGDGDARWTARVPAWLSTRPVDCEHMAIVGDWHIPAERTYNYENLKLQVIATGEFFAVAAHGGIFLLNMADGTTRFSWQPSRRATDYHYYDSGTFEVFKNGKRLCTGKADAARVFALCDRQLIFFDNEITAALSITTGKVLAETPWENRYRERNTPVAHSKARIPLGPYTLVLNGITFM